MNQTMKKRALSTLKIISTLLLFIIPYALITKTININAIIFYTFLILAIAIYHFFYYNKAQKLKKYYDKNPGEIKKQFGKMTKFYFTKLIPLIIITSAIAILGILIFLTIWILVEFKYI